MSLLTVNLGAVVDLVLALTNLLLNVKEQLALTLRGGDGPLACRRGDTAVVGAAVSPVLGIRSMMLVIHIQG